MQCCRISCARVERSYRIAYSEPGLVQNHRCSIAHKSDAVWCRLCAPARSSARECKKRKSRDFFCKKGFTQPQIHKTEQNETTLSLLLPLSHARQSLDVVMREWTDAQVLSHVAFIPSIVVIVLFRPYFFECLLFIVPLVVLSTLFHRHHEPAGSRLAQVELVAAFMLYFYGCAQLFNSVSLFNLLVCSSCCVFTSGTYILTNAKKIHWDPWHWVGMHAVPGVWALAVSFSNTPLFIQ